MTDSDHLNVMLGNQRYIEMITVSTLMWQPSTPASHCALPYHLPTTSIALRTAQVTTSGYQLVTTTSWQVVACYCGAF